MRLAIPPGIPKHQEKQGGGWVTFISGTHLWLTPRVNSSHQMSSEPFSPWGRYDDIINKCHLETAEFDGIMFYRELSWLMTRDLSRCFSCCSTILDSSESSEFSAELRSLRKHSVVCTLLYSWTIYGNSMQQPNHNRHPCEVYRFCVVTDVSTRLQGAELSWLSQNSLK